MRQMKFVGTGVAALALLGALIASAAHADTFQGAIFTSDVNHNTNINLYNSFSDVYLNGGGSGQGDVLDAGKYCYAIVDTSAMDLLSTVGSFTQTQADKDNSVQPFFSIISGPASGGSGISFIGPDQNEYKLLVCQLSTDPDSNLNCPTAIDGLTALPCKSDNFKVAEANTAVVPEPGSLALLATGGVPLLGFLRRRKLA